jgi:hypothetical protein
LFFYFPHAQLSTVDPGVFLNNLKVFLNNLNLHVIKELPTLPEHLSSPPVLSGVLLLDL